MGIPVRQKAKIFMTGRSQAVCLPMAYRFNTPSVYIRKDPCTGDVILSTGPDNWDGFLDALSATDIPIEFLGAQERQQDKQTRDPLEDSAE